MVDTIAATAAAGLLAWASLNSPNPGCALLARLIHPRVFLELPAWQRSQSTLDALTAAILSVTVGAVEVRWSCAQPRVGEKTPSSVDHNQLDNSSTPQQSFEPLGCSNPAAAVLSALGSSNSLRSFHTRAVSARVQRKPLLLVAEGIDYLDEVPRAGLALGAVQCTAAVLSTICCPACRWVKERTDDNQSEDASLGEFLPLATAYEAIVVGESASPIFLIATATCGEAIPPSAFWIPDVARPLRPSELALSCMQNAAAAAKAAAVAAVESHQIAVTGHADPFRPLQSCNNGRVWEALLPAIIPCDDDSSFSTLGRSSLVFPFCVRLRIDEDELAPSDQMAVATATAATSDTRLPLLQLRRLQKTAEVLA